MAIRAVLLPAVLGALVLASPAGGQPLAPWLGVWTLAPESSTSAGSPLEFKRLTCRIESVDGRLLRITYDLVYPRGGTMHLEWNGAPDGREYHLQGVDYVLTNAFTPVDDRTYDVVVKLDGRVVANGRIALAGDGQTITVTGSSPGDRGAVALTLLKRR